MAVSINGTTGISGVDGSAVTPALQGSDTNTGISFGTDEVSVNTGGTERVKVDSSGRLLVGTSTADGMLHVKGANTHGSLVLEAGGTTGSTNLIYLQGHNNAGTAIGEIAFDETATNQGAIVFKTNGGTLTERMRINNYGIASFYTDNSVVGGSGQPTIFASCSSNTATTQYLFYGTHSASGTGTGTNSVQILNNGNVLNTNNSYGALSDIKLKENIVNANSQWSDIKALQVRNYNFKEDQTHTQIGLIAQEVELVSPGLVSESPDCDEEGNDLGTTTKNVNYSVLYMKAVKALQEAMERIETLEAKVAALEGGAS